MVIQARYKVTHILYVEQDYAALRAVDIESRDKEEYLLNVYEGARIKQYVDCFDRLRHCPEYRGMFMADGALVAVFNFKSGSDIDSMFYKGATLDWETRMHYAQLLFHLVLTISDYPPQISCAALLSTNICVWPKERKLTVNYLVKPLEGMNVRELVFLATDHINKIFLRRFSSTNAELALLDTLESGAIVSASALYSYWRSMKDQIQSEYEVIYGKSAIQRGLYLFFKNLSRTFKKLVRKNKKKRDRDT